MNIRINDFDLDDNQIVGSVKLDESTPQELNLMELSREDGAKLISSNFTPKEITIGGIIKGATRASLENNIDTFKKNTMVTEANLDVNYETGYRRWLVDCSECIVTREHHNITIAAFEIKYVASDPPFAEEIDAIGGNPIMNEAFSVDMMTGSYYTGDLEIGGTQKPKPTIKFNINAAGNLKEISFKNNTTNTQVDVTTAWGSGDELEINTKDKTIQLNSYDVEYEGVFPEFNIDDNDVDINFSATGNPNQTQTTYNSDANVYSDWIAEAQSFQVSQTSNYNRIDLLIKKASSFSSDQWLETFSSTTYKDVANTTANWDITNGIGRLNYSGSSIVDSYSESNRNNYIPIGNGTITSISQLFTGNGTRLYSAKFYLKKTGSPTGTIKARFWNSFMSGEPETPYIAESSGYNVASLTSDYQLIEFIFSLDYELEDGEQYCIGLNYNNGDSSNYVRVGSDNSGELMTTAFYNISLHYWVSYNTTYYIHLNKFCFYVYTHDYDTANNIIQSSGFDTGKTSNTFLTGTQSVDLNGGTSTLEFSDSADNSSWSSWTSEITELTRRYIRFRITLSGSTTASPEVNYVTITWVGNLELNICSDTGGAPGAVITTAYIPYTSIGTSYSWVVASFDASLSTGTDYWMYIKPVSTEATARTLYWAYQNSDVYANGNRARKTSSGGSWTDYPLHDHAFKVYIDESASWEVKAKITYQKRYK